ncbi:MAG: CRISPR-associated ring nuclease [Exilispira sp.]
MATLLCSLGLNWEIPFESIAFVCYNESLDFYKDSPYSNSINSLRNQYIKEKVNKVIIFTTEQENINEIIDELLENIEKYIVKDYNFLKKIEIFMIEGLKDIDSTESSAAFENMVYNSFLREKKDINNSSSCFYISIAGGRKTMSSILHNAGFIFGSCCLFHIIEKNDTNRNLRIEEKIKYITPVVFGKYPVSEIYQLIENENQQNEYNDFFNENTSKIVSNKYFEILQYKVKSSYIIRSKVIDSFEKASNFYINQINTLEDNFRILYNYKKEIIELLKKRKIGFNNPSDKELLVFLPKTNLHCHLGGVFDIQGLVDLSLKMKDEIEENLRDEDNIPSSIEEFINIFEKEGGFKKSFKNHKKKSYIILKFISLFEKRKNELESYIFKDYIYEENFRNIGIKNYEKLGDIQGSTILQSKNAIKYAIEYLLNNAIKENIIHLEIRCSPVNYTKEGLEDIDVLRVIIEQIEKYSKDISISLIIIASRHGKMSDVYRHIELVTRIIEEGDYDFKNLFLKYFKGFDLAGDESQGKPEEFRQAFLRIMNYCPNITIHAGETANSESIWQAIYHLNAERIGHGLSLENDDILIQKLIERKIALEMCPSSNYQINNFIDFFIDKKYDLKDFKGIKRLDNNIVKDLKIYPLKKYLDKGLIVTINSDNDGISRTTISNEFYKACRMTEGGLNLWDILKIIKYGIKASFVSVEKKRKLYKIAEERINNFILSKILS